MTRFLRRFLMFLLAVAAVLAVGTFLPRPLVTGRAADAPLQHHILVLTNPIHTDIAIPIDDEVRRRFAFLDNAGMPIAAPGARYLVFGWGGRAFYIATPTWADLQPVPLLKGLTLDRSVLHVDITGDISELHPAVRRHDLDAAGFGRLLSFVQASFSEDAAGKPQAIADAGYGEFDRFYKANGYFTALLGCNTWTAQALRAGGLRTGWWNPLPATLRVSLSLYNEKHDAVSFPPTP